MADTAYLILENGRVFTGKRAGAEKDVIAEIAFTTGEVGYLETLTDKSFHGQAVVQTFPIIGSYGVIPSDFESDKIQLSAYIVRELCNKPSNFRCEGTLGKFLADSKIPVITGLDTRALTKVIREQGAMNCMITGTLPSDMDETLSKIRAYRIKGAVPAVSCKEKYVEKAQGEKKRSIALYDFGMKKSILSELTRRGCEVTVFPCGTPAAEVLASKPDGIVLSNGPGDPKDNPGIISELKKIAAAKVPTLGICLGHQLFALANGFSSEKLKYGHRGENQPVRDTATGRVYVTSQNHGYAIVCGKDNKNNDAFWINENDGTVEGIEYRNLPALTFQFHPEACSGPEDTNFLFDRFISMADAAKQ